LSPVDEKSTYRLGILMERLPFLLILTLTRPVLISRLPAWAKPGVMMILSKARQPRQQFNLKLLFIMRTLLLRDWVFQAGSRKSDESAGTQSFLPTS
jgi:hypothetical protein